MFKTIIEGPDSLNSARIEKIAYYLSINVYFRYNLKENGAIIIGESQKHLIEDVIKNYKISYTPGGSAFSTIAIAQRLLGKQTGTIYFGPIGNIIQ